MGGALPVRAENSVYYNDYRCLRLANFRRRRVYALVQSQSYAAISFVSSLAENQNECFG